MSIEDLIYDAHEKGLREELMKEVGVIREDASKYGRERYLVLEDVYQLAYERVIKRSKR